MSKQINWRAHAKTRKEPLTWRDHQVAWLTGALSMVSEDRIYGPASPELLREFLYGQSCVDRGMIAINNVPAFRAFIEDVRTGRWPERRSA